MFDKLVESNSNGADVESRGRYFMVSSVVVGILFFSAIVYSLYAADISIGNGEFDMSRMLAPEVIEVPEQQPVDRPQPRNAPAANVPTRTANIARIDEPQFIPTEVSVKPSNVVARPNSPFVIGPKNLDVPDAPNSVPRTNNGNEVGSGTSSGTGYDRTVSKIENVTPPPAPKAPPIQSLGVINGRAVSLPPPPYPAIARSTGVSGNVSVQVVINEDGKVVSSRAIDGHPMLKPAAEKAAWNAKFSTTYLSKQPVKVTGVIVYRFKKS